MAYIVDQKTLIDGTRWIIARGGPELLDRIGDYESYVPKGGYVVTKMVVDVEAMRKELLIWDVLMPDEALMNDLVRDLYNEMYKEGYPFAYTVGADILSFPVWWEYKDGNYIIGMIGVKSSWPLVVLGALRHILVGLFWVGVTALRFVQFVLGVVVIGLIVVAGKYVLELAGEGARLAGDLQQKAGELIEEAKELAKEPGKWLGDIGGIVVLGAIGIFVYMILSD